LGWGGKREEGRGGRGGNVVGVEVRGKGERVEREV